ncbi:MAG: N-acetylmuramic acid 6-phosphate etherase [Gemmatimonadota bacterium]|nr:MAG: N-acetylmuramic acid 6-phosphate etherase [Gemmatimonadota bacterium]
MNPEFLDHRLTEQRNPATVGIDVASSLEIVDQLHAQDATVAHAVHQTRRALARTIDLVLDAFKVGGRLIYVGAGTSGRLGVLDAAECPPTFGSPAGMVSGIIAGGPAALTGPQEGAEDDAGAAVSAIADKGVTGSDVVIGIAASGTTPYVRAALLQAKTLGASVVLVTCTDPPEELTGNCDEVIVAKVGPEALTGSTRLKAGTATKLILNTITTGSMIRLGKAYGNLMVDLVATSDKLRDRGERILMEAGGVDRVTARSAIEAAGGAVKTALVMVRLDLDRAEAERRLTAASGVVRAVIGDPPPVVTNEKED